MATDAVTSDGRARVLADENRIPMLGLGVWQVPDGPECVNAVRSALELGYRHIDTAQAYGNEESVGRGLRESGVAREEVFITTKFYPAHQDPVVEAEHSLRRLGVEEVDLYIVHWPQGGPTWAWPGMERARELGYTRSIGVSNFDVGELEEVTAAASVAPAINQVQFSPFDRARGLQPPGDGAAPLQRDRRPDRAGRRAHAGAGAAALVPAARGSRHHEVDTP
jgi:diketogulonate reductase-like aldo/keto reductase